jgi:hypothetical protein
MTLLAAYEKTLLPYTRMKGEWTNQDYDWEPGQEPRWQGVTQQWTVLRDGDRAKVVSWEIGGKSKSKTVFEDVIQQGKRWVSVYPDGSLFSRLKVSAESFPERLGMAPSCPCYGISFQVWIPGFLRASKLSVEKDTLEGTAVDVLRGVSGEVEIGLWLDPSLGYTARRIRYEKHGSPRHSQQFDVQRFQQQDGLFVVAEATSTCIDGSQPVLSPIVGEKVVDGKRVEVRNQPARDAKGNVVVAPERRYLRTVKLVGLDFHPQFSDGDFEISQSIRNGTKVNMRDAPHLNYMWEDGKIVPGLDAEALATARDAQFRAGGGGRWLFRGLSAGVFLVLIGWLLFRRLAVKHKV